MKKLHDLFQEAKRVKPSPELWQRIESQVALKRAGMDSNRFIGFDRLWHTPFFRLAASVTLATSFLGLGMFMQHRGQAGKKTAFQVDSSQVHAEPVSAEFLDSELLGWDADLGELELDTDDSAEEVL